MEIVYTSVRVIHVLSSVFWAGAAFLVVLFLEPSIREAGASGRDVMGGMVRRGYPAFVNSIALVTVLTGLWLFWTMSGHFSPAFMGSRPGILLSTGMLAGILALGMGHMVGASARKLAALGARVAAPGAPSSAADEDAMRRLQGRTRLFARVAAVLLLVAVLTMTLGRHA